MSLLRRLFGSAMMGEALRARRDILLESFNILRKETTMGTERTYTLTGKFLSHLHNDDQYTVQVPAEELRRVLREEGAAINAGTIATFFGMTIDSVLELRRQYDLRGGSPSVSPETVRAAFGPLPTIRVSGGSPGVTYAVDLGRRTVEMVGSTVSRDEIRAYSYVDVALGRLQPERRYATASRRRLWDGTSSYPRRRAIKGGRRAGDRLERRQPGRAPRRQRGEDRRAFDGFPASWRHACAAQLYYPRIFRSAYCPDCAMPRGVAIERRGPPRRTSFSCGRRGEDA